MRAAHCQNPLSPKHASISTAFQGPRHLEWSKLSEPITQENATLRVDLVREEYKELLEAIMAAAPDNIAQITSPAIN